MRATMQRWSANLLILPILLSFVMWTVGISSPILGLLYEYSFYWLVICLTLQLIIYSNQFTKSDWLILGFAIVIFAFYTATSSLRHSNRAINASLSMIVLLFLSYRKQKFSKFDYQKIVVICGLTTIAISYRLIVEISKLLNFELALSGTYKFESLWINTNTIGAAVLFATILATFLMKQMSKNIFNQVSIGMLYLLGLFAIWLSQSKTSFAILLLFILLDNFFPKKWLQKNKIMPVLIIFILISAPFFSYYFSQNTEWHLFTERELIWHEFFEQWLSKKQNILIGMAPFEASWKPLGTHNSFLLLLGRYGVIGYTLFTGYFVWLIRSIQRKKGAFSSKQINSFCALVVLLVYCFMEDSLLMYHWMPVIFSFLGFSLHKEDKQECEN